MITQATKMYYGRLNAGVCPRCGGPRGEHRWIHCAACLVRRGIYSAKKNRIYKRNYTQRNIRRKLCPVCGRLKDNGFKNCAFCRERSREAFRIRNAVPVENYRVG